MNSQQISHNALGPVKYFCIVLRYQCPTGHFNQTSKLYCAPDEMPVSTVVIQFHLTRKPLVLECSVCPPGTFLRPKSKKEAEVSVWVRALTPEQFEESGLPAESLAD